MTQPTQTSSSPGPSTVIGRKPLGFDPITALTEAVKGHSLIVEAIHDHAVTRARLRDAARASLAAGSPPDAAVGGGVPQ